MKRDGTGCESGYPSDGPARTLGVRRDRLSALNQLVLEDQSVVYNLVYRILGDPDLAATATERTFLKAFRGQRPRGWPPVRRLMRIAVAICQEELRQAPILSSDSRTPLVGDNAHESVTAHSAYQSSGGGVQAFLGTLPPDQRVILVLSDVQGLSYREVAHVTGVSVDVARSRLSRGRTALRNALLARGEISPGVQP